jgi:molecular chaperone HscB
MNHFELFGLTPAVDVDVKALEQRHRDLSLEVHPDRLTQADAATRRRAAEASATLNDAIKTLRDPVRRAYYLLKLNGVDLESEGAADRHALPMAFLEDILERREALEVIKQRRDLDGATTLGKAVKGELDRALEKAQAALRAHDVKEAAAELGRLKYYSRFLEEVDAFEEELTS